jgi:hypothetical protein
MICLPRIFENKMLYALEEDSIKFGWRADKGVVMVRNNRCCNHLDWYCEKHWQLTATRAFLDENTWVFYTLVLLWCVFRDLRAWIPESERKERRSQIFTEVWASLGFQIYKLRILILRSTIFCTSLGTSTALKSLIAKRWLASTKI